jgi:hypothetical protein
LPDAGSPKAKPESKQKYKEKAGDFMATERRLKKRSKGDYMAINRRLKGDKNRAFSGSGKVDAARHLHSVLGCTYFGRGGYSIVDISLGNDGCPLRGFGL